MPNNAVAGASQSSLFEVEIVAVAGSKVRGVVTVAAEGELSGTLAALSRELPAAPWTLQIARRELGQHEWHILAPLARLRVERRKIQWRLTGVDFGGDLAFGGCGRSFELRAVVATHPLPLSAFDQITLSAVAALSKPVEIRRQPCPTPLLPASEPNISIAEIGLRAVDPVGRFEVGLEETLHGEVTMPAESVVRLVVQPLNAVDRWVMEMYPQVSGASWTGRAYFGRQGLDEWVDFLVFAVVTDPRLPTGRGIGTKEWLDLERRLFLATSPAILVRRVELAPAEEVTLEILAVDGKSVVEPGLYLVDRSSGIFGSLQGRPLLRNEKVWLLAMERHSDAVWRTLGQATVHDHRFWQLLPVTLGEPGDLVDLVAVLSAQPIVTLGSNKASQAMAMSPRVQLVLDDRPPVEVLWTCIAGEQASEGESLTIPPLGELAGLVAGRSLSSEEQVMIFKRRLDKGPWQLVRHGDLDTERRSHWSVLPVELGRPGDKLLLLAVVARGEVRELEATNPGEVVSFSRLLEVHIRRNGGAYGRCR